jgi:hypothetical protein
MLFFLIFLKNCTYPKETAVSYAPTFCQKRKVVDPDWIQIPCGSGSGSRAKGITIFGKFISIYIKNSMLWIRVHIRSEFNDFVDPDPG